MLAALVVALGLCISLLHLLAQDFIITDLAVDGDEATVEVESDTNRYYLLYAGESVTAEVSAVDAALGETNHTELLDGRGDGQTVVIRSESAPDQWEYPLNTYWHDARLQVMYLPADVGGSETIRSLGLNVLGTPGQTLSNFTIRLKHAPLGYYTWDSQLETSGWLIVYQAHETIGDTGWYDFVFQQSFAYDAASNLVVDFSFNNDSYTTAGSVESFWDDAGRRSVVSESDSGHGDPLNWSGTDPDPDAWSYAPAVRLGVPEDRRYYRVMRGSVAAPGDMDGDGIDDAYELGRTILDPLDPGDADQDHDGDGIPTRWEYLFHTDPEDDQDEPDLSGSLDSDGDGYQDNYEIIHGSHTNDPASTPPGSLYVAAGAYGGDGSQQNPYGIIQAALNAAGAFDVIEVADGTYTGYGNRNLNFLGKTVMLVSTGGAAACAIDCQNAARGAFFTNGEDRRTVLMGITVRNGSSDGGGGVWCYQSSPTISRCTFANNTSTGAGGGLYCNVSSARIDNCSIVQNQAQWGGGTFCKTSGVVLQDCTIAGNTATSRGGGVLSEAGSLDVQGCSIASNAAPAGGGLECTDGSIIALQDCDVAANSVTEYGGGARILTGALVAFHDSRISSNRAPSGGGAGVAAADARVELLRTELTGNSGYWSGALDMWRSDLSATNCVLMGNRSDDEGAGVNAYESTISLVNCSILGNRAVSRGGGLGFFDRTNALSAVHNCIIWDNTPNQISTNCELTVSYCDVQGGWPGTGNIDADPLPTVAGHRLRAASPCIDAGSSSNAPATDLDAETRWDDPAHSNVVSTVDMGADEFVDTDGDDMADRWEQSQFQNLSRDGTADADADGGADGLTDLREYETGTDPNRADTDADGLLDGAEVDTHGTFPLDPDSDGDGMKDGWEVQYGLNPLDASDIMVDLDEDGYGEIYEHLYGSDPTNLLAIPSPTIHVDASAPGGGDGSSGTPFNTIQAGLDAATDHDIIGLADGIYTGAGNRDLDYLGKPVMVTSTGGPADCVIDCENADRGVRFFRGEDRRSVLAWLTIRNASGSGVMFNNATGTIFGCTITGCQATHGGGLSCSGSAPYLRKCTIADNRAAAYFGSGTGGGLLIDGSSSPVVEDCIITSNTASLGGGFYAEDSLATFRACLIEHNTASSGPGGAGGYHDGSDIVFEDCDVQWNWTRYSGGGILSSTSTSVFERCRFVSNQAGRWRSGGSASGGALYAHMGSVLTSRNSLFLGNRVEGAAYYNTGGAIYASDTALSLVNCTLLDNEAEYAGGGLSLQGTPPVPPEVRNCILWSNRPDQVDSSLSGFVSYSDVEGGGAGVGNLNLNPQVTVDGRLLAASPCIDAGSSSNAPATDLDGEARWDDPAHANVVSLVDMGADEFVDTDNDDMADHWERLHFQDLSRDGTSDADADGGPDGLNDRQEYEHGTDPHKADTDGDGLADGAEVNTHGTDPARADTDGDDAGDGWELTYGHLPLDPSDVMRDADGDGYGAVYEFLYGSHPLVTTSVPVPSLYVDGSAPGGADGSPAHPFQAIQDGIDAALDYDIVAVADGIYTGSTNKYLDYWGKPIMVTSTSRADRCIIDCQGSQEGFTIHRGEDQRSVVRGFTVKRGDGISCQGSSPHILDCIIVSNRSSGVSLSGPSSPVVRNCVIADNEEWFYGGGLNINSPNASIENCLIAGNTAAWGGGLWATANATNLLVQNCTIVSNRSRQVEIGGGGLRLDTPSQRPVRNCILWGNTPNQIVSTFVGTVTHCLVEGGWSGTGNLDADPELTRDHRLLAQSPCIDAGSNSNAPPYDLDGEVRWDDPGHSNAISIVDMGADEFVDTDDDDLADRWERRHFTDLSHDGTADADPDGGADGLTDLEEYRYATDPNQADSDSDGLTDGSEVKTHTTDPLDANSDDDNLVDGQEIAIGSDPLDPYDIKITAHTVNPIFFDPHTNQTTISFDVNWTSDVTVAIHPATSEIDFQGDITMTLHTNVVRSWKSGHPAGSVQTVWDGLDQGGQLPSDIVHVYSVEATNVLGLVAEPYRPDYVRGPVTVTNTSVSTNFSFWANEPCRIGYELYAPAFVVLAVPIRPYPVVWGEPRDTGAHIESWQGRNSIDNSLLYGDFEVWIKTHVLPENAMVFDYGPAPLVTNLQAEAYLIAPGYHEVSTLYYGLGTNVEVGVRIRDPDGNMITVLDPTNQPSGAYSVEWAGDVSNRLVTAEGAYEVTLEAHDPVSGIRQTNTANVSVWRSW